MLKGLGVQNLRSFKEYVYSELKPLTIYLGRNSSGKSSLIRLFPLLRQSIQETTTGPILWYGKYVDYGSFNEAICKNSNNKENITLVFDFDFLKSKRGYRNRRNINEAYNVSVELNIAEHDKKTFTKSIGFKIDDSEILIFPSVGNKKVLIQARSNSFKYEIEISGVLESDNKFFPNLLWEKGSKEKSNKGNDPWLINDEYHEYLGYLPFRNLLMNRHIHGDKIMEITVSEIKKFFHSNTSDSTIENKIRHIPFLTKKKTEEIVQELFKNQIYFQNKIKTPDVLTEFMDILYPLILLKNYYSIIENINESLKKSFLSVKYLAPIRANSERFYRFQDLQVNEMDHTGSNVAMILNSFPKNEKLEFEKWTKNHFGFAVHVITDGSHFTIKIKTENDTEEHNIHDMGYGFSQVLPIIMSIWLEMKNSSDSDNEEVLFIIEQPELHLHPEYQAKVANVFAKVVSSVKKNNKNIKFIFETHSQSMINEIGQCIQDKIISKEDVNIMIFEKNKEFGSTAFNAEFDEDGYLINWPIGFFSGE